MSPLPAALAALIAFRRPVTSPPFAPGDRSLTARTS
ncbi:hypothetical protein ATKI12_5385 [Kitasatospora sp. Ki12]